MRVTQNWLVGLTRYPDIVQRFPFLRTLANRYRVQTQDCTSCGQKAQVRQFTDQVNEASKILATIPETEIEEFKRMVNVEKLHITYVDIRGQIQTIVR